MMDGHGLRAISESPSLTHATSLSEKGKRRGVRKPEDVKKENGKIDKRTRMAFVMKTWIMVS